MPISRYEIRNEYSLADPELYREADKDDPEALLEGVAMAGLVGVLRQLGDLAEFAAEIFHDLHEEVMVTAARGHGLMVRVQQIEAEFPAIEKAFLSQTSHAPFFSNAGIDWHPNLQTNQNLITRGDLPRFIMDSYEECRGPPRLFLLDKFDVAGAGACLKRYTDPSFFKVEASSFIMTGAEVQMEKKTRKAKKKGSRWRNGETPEVLPTSHAKLHQLFLEERVERGVSDPARLVKLKRRLNGFPFHSKTGKSYMENFLKTPSPEDKMVHEISVGPPLSNLPSNIATESEFEVEDNEGSNRNFEAGNIPSILHYTVDEKDIAVDRESKTDGSEDGYQSDEIASEIDNYVDALATMESEIETDREFRTKNDLGFLNFEKQGEDSDVNKERQLQSQYSDSQSAGNSSGSDDGNNSWKKSISRISYSDTASNLPENTLPDGDVKARNFASTEICEAEHADVSSDQASISQEVPVAHPAEASSTSCLTDSANMILPVVDCEEILTDDIIGGPELDEISSNPNELDPGFIYVEENETNREKIGTEGSLGGPELDEISSNPNELDTGFINTEENDTNLDDNLETNEDFGPIESAENLPLDNLDDEDADVFSSASVLSSHISEDVLEKKSTESMSDSVPHIVYAEDICPKNLANTQIVSPDSVISHAEDQPLVPALLEFETWNSDTKPEGIVSVADDILSVGKIGVDFTPALDSLDAPNFTEQQVSKITDDGPPLDLDSTAVGISYSGERILELPSDFSNTPEAASLAEFHVQLDERAEAILSDTVVDAAVADNDADKDDANFQLANFRNLQEECLPESDQNALEINNACLPQNRKESGFESELLNNVTASSTSGEAENCIHLDNSTTVSSYSKQRHQESESESPQQSNVIVEAESESESESPQQVYLLEEMENDLSSPTCRLADLTTPFEQKVEVHDDQHDMERPEFSQSENTQSSKYMDCERSLDAYFESSPVNFPLQPSEQKVELQADQLGVESLQVGESCVESSSHMESPSIVDHDRHVNASLESCLAPLPVVPFFDLLPEASQINLEEMPPLPPLPPVQWRIGKLQHASGQHNLGHFPPMFPSIADERTQMGYPSFERDLMQKSSNPFSLSLPVKEENQEHAIDRNMVNSTPFSLQIPTVSNHGGSHDAFHTNPFIISQATYNEVSMQPSFNQFSPETTFGDEASTYASVTQSLHQLPAAPSLENEKVDQSSVISGLNVESSPNTRAPSLENGKLDQSSVISGVKVESSPDTSAPSREYEKLDESSIISGLKVENSPHTSAPSREYKKLDQSSVISGVRVENSPNTSAPSLENEKLDQSSEISEVKVENSPSTSVSPATIEDELPQPVRKTSEGEILWSSSTSLPPTVEDDGKTNLIRPLRIPRPRSPLIDAVAAHDKSKLRKVTERARRPIPKVDERDSLLEQIRTKSFSLKPAIPTRPSIGGPKTNLKVAAILEKANSIRQALAGSDEDDDTDWSD